MSVSFISLLPHILQIQHTILHAKYIYLTRFFDKPVPNNIKINIRACLKKLDGLKIIGDSWNLTYFGA